MSNFMDKFKDVYSTSSEESGKSFILPGVGTEVKYKTFTSGDQKEILKALEQKDILKADAEVDKIIKKYTNIDPHTLISADRHALIIKMRQDSIGDEVDYTSICTNEECQHRNEIHFSISDYELHPVEVELKETEIEINKNLRFILGYVTRGDELELSRYIKFVKMQNAQNAKGKKKEKEEENISSTELRFGTYAIVIKQVIFINEAGEEEITSPSFNDKMQMLHSLSMFDSEKIINYIKEQPSFGYDITCDVECTECENAYKEDIEWIAMFIK
jgi:hypothetical protein